MNVSCEHGGLQYRLRQRQILLSTRLPIKIAIVYNLTGNEDSKEMLALKQSMAEALKLRQTELEDKLYDKVQELKKLCLEESVSRF